MLAWSAEHDLDVHLMDISTGFLSAGVWKGEDTSILQPPGYGDGTGRVLKPRKALYGLKQASRVWYFMFRQAWEELGYSPCPVDPAIYLRDAAGSELKSIVYTHVDDAAGSGPSVEVKQDIEKILTKFPGRCLGEGDGQKFLGMMHERDRELWCCSLHTDPPAVHATSRNFRDHVNA
jgi:hypothetical protein